jgi:hypothetical protein
VLGALSQPDEGNVGSLSRRYGSNILDLDLASDHLVPESGD